MYTRFCSAVLFPIQERLKHHTSVALRRELEHTQWLPREELARLQTGRLRKFLIAAAHNVPYYRTAFARVGFDPATVKGVDDLRRLPFLDKPLIRAHTAELKSERSGPLTKFNTGGSSGEPLVFFQGLERITHDVASKWRATRWWGVDIGDPEVVLWGSPIEIGKQDRVKAIRDWVFRSHLLPAFQLSDDQMDRYLDEIRRIRPRMFFGYASALALLTEHATRRGCRLDDLGVKVAFTTGETLYPDQRAIIEKVLGAPVANGYGSRDAGFIAHECPHGSLHMTAEHVVVELVAEDGKPVAAGETGEIVVTHMATGDFPFIRYRTGDMAVESAERCSCGRGLPVLQTVHGRSTDFILTPSGNRMHALALIYEVRDKPGVHAFKFVQDEDCSLTLLVVAGPEFSAEIEASVRAGLMARMGGGASIDIRRVAEIPPEKSGKYRYVVSRARSQAVSNLS